MQNVPVSSARSNGAEGSRRRHLAVREHMMDHILDQSPTSRPGTPSNFALPAPVMFSSNGSDRSGRRPSVVSDVINPLTGLPGATPHSRHTSVSSQVSSTSRTAHRDSSSRSPAFGFSPDGTASSTAKRSSLTVLSQIDAPGQTRGNGQTSERISPIATSAPPILVNPKCSGYFVEPVSL